MEAMRIEAKLTQHKRGRGPSARRYPRNVAFIPALNRFTVAAVARYEYFLDSSGVKANSAAQFKLSHEASPI